MTKPTLWNGVGVAEGATQIAAAVDELRPALVDFARDLVRIPSLPGNEASAHQFVADKLRSMQLEVTMLESRFDDLRTHPAFSDDGLPADGRLNVVARWPGASSRPGSRSLILNGHLDVVPTGGRSLWIDDPFSGIVRDGRLFGRGSCDMKGGVAAAVFAVEALRRLGRHPGGDVLLQTVSGEESGGVGTLTTIVKGFRADAAIILEPTRLRLCPIQSGALTFRLRVQGRAIHACMKRSGVSAIEKACYLMARLDELDADRHRARPNPYYPDPMNIAPISVGTLSGGDWHSTVPHEAVIEGRYGIFVGESVADAKHSFAAAVREAAAADSWLREHPPGLEWFEGQFESGQTPVDAPILRELSACHEAMAGESPALEGVPYGSDLRLFTNHARIPAVLYGPGDVANAHSVDEFVELEQVVTATKVLALTVAMWCR
jgi:acetylornithine deacetylase